MPTTKVATVTQNRSPGTGRGTNRPRLLSSITPSILMLSRGTGSSLRTPKYQMKMISSGGMLRKSSTQAAAAVLTMKLVDRRRDADDEAENGREDHAGDGNEYRVEQADKIDGQIGRLAFVIGNERLADAEVRRCSTGSRSRRRCAARAKRREHVGDGRPAQVDHDREQHDLVEPASDRRVVENGNPRRLVAARNPLNCHGTPLIPGCSLRRTSGRELPLVRYRVYRISSSAAATSGGRLAPSSDANGPGGMPRPSTCC